MYRKNTANKSYLSTSLIDELRDDARSSHSIGRLDDSYKSLSQLKFDDGSNLYIDYFTCQEYNKKLLKKLNNLNRNNERLSERLRTMRNNFDREVDRRLTESSLHSAIAKTKGKSGEESTKSEYDYDYILPKAKSIKKPTKDKSELLEKLFEADTPQSVKDVGNRLATSIDRLIADLDETSVRSQNKYLYKKIDQLQRENERYRYLFEMLDGEMN